MSTAFRFQNKQRKSCHCALKTSSFLISKGVVDDFVVYRATHAERTSPPAPPTCTRPLASLSIQIADAILTCECTGAWIKNNFVGPKVEGAFYYLTYTYFTYVFAKWLASCVFWDFTHSMGISPVTHRRSVLPMHKTSEEMFCGFWRWWYLEASTVHLLFVGLVGSLMVFPGVVILPCRGLHEWAELHPCPILLILKA